MCALSLVNKKLMISGLNQVQRRSESNNSDDAPCVSQTKCSCTHLQQSSSIVDANSVDEFTQRLYETQAAARRELLKKIRNGDDYSILYSILAPEVRLSVQFCVYLRLQVECRNVVRLGALRDGGKWVCAPTRVDHGNCVLYSLGIHNEISFDTEFQHATNQSCRYRAVDKVRPTCIVNLSGVAWIAGKAEDFYAGCDSLAGWAISTSIYHE